MQADGHYNGRLKWPPTDGTITGIFFLGRNNISPRLLLNCRCLFKAPIVLLGLPLLLQLPATLVVSSIVDKLAAIAEPTKASFIVILAQIRCIVKPDRVANVRGTCGYRPSYGATLFGGGSLILGGGGG